MHCKCFLQSLNYHLTTITSYKNIIIAGDININILPGSLKENSHDYLDICAIYGIFPAHTLVTHKLGACLDHIMLKSNSPSSLTLVTNSSLTDHYAVLHSLSLKTPPANNRTRKTINACNLKLDIENLDLDPIYSSADYSTSLEYLMNNLQAIILKNTTIRQLPKSKTNIKPWITPGLIRCMRHRDKLHMKVKSSPNNEILLLTYKRYRNFCNNLLRKLKVTYEKTEFQKSKISRKLMWNYIKTNTFTKNVTEHPLTLLSNINSQPSKVNEINNYFTNIGKTLANNLNQTSFSSAPLYNKLSHCCHPNSFVMLEPDIHEVETIIRGLKTHSATGYDNIPTKIVQDFMHILAVPLLYIFKGCIKEGIFPKYLKKAIVLPIYKGGDKSMYSNYRSISILPVFLKILEKIINNRLVLFLEDQGLLSSNQFGFR